LLGRISLAGGALATFGLIQFVTHQPWTDHIVIPGLSANQTIYGAQSREGFTRPSGTAIHPIEFGAVLCMILPLSLARSLTGSALGAGRARGAIRRWYPTLAIAVAITISISRSAMVSAAVAVLVLIPVLSRRTRRLTYVLGGLLAVAVFVLVPGMLGSILGLFTGIGTDTSSRSRLDSYGIAFDYFSRSPVLGRGFSTFLPRYRIFDNEYLLLLVEVGVVGVLALLWLIGSALHAGSRARRLSTDAPTRYLAQGLVASVAAGATSVALFDAFSFPMVPGTLFLMMGCCGALLRTVQADAEVGDVIGAGAGPDGVGRQPVSPAQHPVTSRASTRRGAGSPADISARTGGGPPPARRT